MAEEMADWVFDDENLDEEFKIEVKMEVEVEVKTEKVELELGKDVKIEQVRIFIFSKIHSSYWIFQEKV